MKAQFLHQAPAKSNGNPMLGALGTIAGTAIGTALGGPMGGALGGSLGGQLAGKGTIDPAATISSAGGQMLMGKATEGLTDAMSGLGAKDVSILDDPLKANVAVTKETMSNVPQASADPFAKSALGQPMVPNTAVGGQPSIMQAAPLGIAAPTLESFSKMDPSKLGFQTAMGGGGLASFMKGIFG